jgi:cytochrome bd-type quinol oxidase subunit 2
VLGTALSFVTAIGLLVFIGAIWFGMALTVRGGYRWAFRSTSSRVLAIGAAAAGGIVGAMGGWVVADARAVVKARGRRAWIWAAAAWIAAGGMSELMAASVADSPQPSQHTWVLVLEWLPVLPLLATLVVALALRIRDQRSPWSSRRVPQVLFWCSFALFCLVVPKPN